MADIAVIGAGMAGLSALQELAAAGHQVQVYDKSRGSGGRMATKALAGSGWDMGAQFLRAHSPDFAHQLSQWQQAGWIEPWSPTICRYENDCLTPSPDAVSRYVGVPRMTALSRGLLQSAAGFHPAVRISTVRFAEQRWQLQSDDGTHLASADALVISAPPAQSAALLENTVPPLAAHCRQQPMLPCWTLLISVQQPLAVTADAVFVRQGPLGWIARNSSKPGRSGAESWVIQASHTWSATHNDSPREAVQQMLLEAFCEVFKLDTISITGRWLHRWLYALPASTGNAEFLAAGGLPLAVCGDWCHHPSVEGAWHSGRRAGQYLNHYLATSSGHLQERI